MQSKVIIIILNWNGLNDTIECIESIKTLEYVNYEIILVDNNSSGNDVKIINEKYGGVIKQIVTNDENYGYAGGNNIGIKEALKYKPDYVLLLNNDTIVEPDFLTKLIDKSELSKDIGILTPMINFYSRKDTIWSAGGYISKIRASGFSFGYNQHQSSFNKDFFCSFASGCCLLIKKEVIENIGFLDERYFLYLEDTDYCQRVINAGYKILFVAKSKIYHKVFSTTAKASPILPLYFSTRNRLYFAKKNLKRYYIVVILYITLVFLFKLIFFEKNKYTKMKIIYFSFKDHFLGNLGKGSYSKIIDVKT